MKGAACFRCEVVLADYRFAVWIYDRLVTQLAASEYDPKEFMQTWNEVKRASAECAKLRSLMLEHLAIHWGAATEKMKLLEAAEPTEVFGAAEGQPVSAPRTATRTVRFWGVL
jgi:hypothetical protein